MPQQEQNTPALRFSEFTDGWEKMPLGKIGEVIRGASPRPKGDKRYYGGNIPRLMVEDVTRDGKYVTPCTDYLTEEGAKLSRPCKKGTLTVVCSGNVGVPAILAVDACIHDGFLAFRDIKKNYDLEFVYTYLSRLQSKFDASATHGGIFVNLTTTILKEFMASFPSQPEQQKIAAFLGAVDEKIAQLQKKKDLLEDYKKGSMQKLFSQEIRFTDNNGNPFPDWEEKSLDEIKSNERHSFTGGPFGSNLKSDEYTETGIRIIQLQNIGDGQFYDDYKIYTSPQKADELNSCNIYPGEIIISKMGDPVARACLVPTGKDSRYLMASDGIRLSVDKTRFSIKFIHDSINHSEFRKKALAVSTGSTRKRIGLSELRALTISIPHSDEQKKIAGFLSAIDDKIALVSKELDKAKTFKKGLLQQMFV
jgi:type I restriction enzyme S subunit